MSKLEFNAGEEGALFMLSLILVSASEWVMNKMRPQQRIGLIYVHVCVFSSVGQGGADYA